MRKLRAPWKRLCAALARRPLDDNFDEELEAHVALDTERGVRHGLTHEEARRQALIRLRARSRCATRIASAAGCRGSNRCCAIYATAPVRSLGIRL